ncbi:outer membrane protein assembly factor BamB [Halomonas halocynthiae]|uniref:outer membrane protein assembly factor BamB n=1 Tax=Halomonas halocynthiae TaxID=176290 RepID=UPI0003F6BD96|nr:outer membrane protein assembly factor BamB [Halomonas halocynthiae]
MTPRLIIAALATISISLLAGCSGKVEPQYPPKELRDLSATAQATKVWSQSIGSGLGKGSYPMAPAQDGARVFAADYRGLVTALDTDTGNTLWETTLSSGASSALSAVDGQLYFGTRNGEVVAMDQSTGKVLWKSTISSEVLAAPQANNQLLIVQSVDGRITALNRNNGTEFWSYSASQPLLSLRTSATPRVIDAVTIAGLANGRLVTLDNRTGQPLWERRISNPTGNSDIERLSDLSGQPLLTPDGRLYATSYNGRVVALEATSGQVAWSRPLSSYRSPLMVGETLFVVDEASQVVALNAITGDELWRLKDLEGRSLTDPEFAGGQIVLGDYDGYVHLINANTGKLSGRSHVDGSGISVAPQTDGRRVYVLANDGTLQALDIR